MHALFITRDSHHAAAVDLFDSFGGELVVPSLIVAEVCYLLQTRIGPEAENAFLDSVVVQELVVEELTDADWERVAALVP